MLRWDNSQRPEELLPSVKHLLDGEGEGGDRSAVGEPETWRWKTLRSHRHRHRTLAHVRSETALSSITGLFLARTGPFRSSRSPKHRHWPALGSRRSIEQRPRRRGNWALNSGNSKGQGNRELSGNRCNQTNGKSIWVIFLQLWVPPIWYVSKIGSIYRPRGVYVALEQSIEHHNLMLNYEMWSFDFG